jgi:hypothetical protein
MEIYVRVFYCCTRPIVPLYKGELVYAINSVCYFTNTHFSIGSCVRVFIIALPILWLKLLVKQLTCRSVIDSLATSCTTINNRSPSCNCICETIASLSLTVNYCDEYDISEEKRHWNISVWDVYIWYDYRLPTPKSPQCTRANSWCYVWPRPRHLWTRAGPPNRTRLEPWRDSRSPPAQFDSESIWTIPHPQPQQWRTSPS